MIIFTIRIALPDLAFFHLITHALFKALLFICAGYIINAHHHSQDLRTIGNTVTQIPMIRAAILIANFALCGAPFMAGFYSKDAIIENFRGMQQHPFMSVIFRAATVLTTAYSTRFALYVLISPTYRPSRQYTRESITEFYSSSTLTVGAIIGGAAINWACLLYTSPSPRDRTRSRMPSSA